MNIKSEKKTINGSVEELYSKVSNLSNLSPILDGKVQNWKATENECSFSISAMGTNANISMYIAEKIPNERISIQTAQGGSPIPFSAILYLEKIDDNSFNAQIEINADVPFAFSVMAKKPLQQLADKLMEALMSVMGN
jgi:hypothetical protein